MDAGDLVQKVFFIGGDESFGSVRIRTVQIARHLRCDFAVNSAYTPDQLEGKKLFVFTKAFAINRDMLRELRTRGKVIIDIIDLAAIPRDVDGYFTSSLTAAQAINVHAKPVFVIPHHHCNCVNAPNPIRDPKKVCFIGDLKWYPVGLLPPHAAYFDMAGPLERLVAAYRQADVLLNFRMPPSDVGNNPHRAHLLLSGGIKLINAMAFGIPSLSADEPVYREVGSECTQFSTFERCQQDLRDLLENPVLYGMLRANCLARAPEYSIDVIGKKYLAAFAALLS